MDRKIGFLALSLWVLLLSGCGGMVVRPTECVSDYPLKNYVYSKDSWGPFVVDSHKVIDSPEGRNPSGNPLTKDDFLQDFGKPDEIVALTADQEMWVYNRSKFCGVVPVFIVPVPLVLPVCDTFDHITFENDKAVHIHFRRASGAGLASIGASSLAFGFDKCPADYASISPEVIPIPGTEECRQVGYNNGVIWWTDGYDLVKIEPHTREVIARVPVADRNDPPLDLLVTGFGAAWAGRHDFKHKSISRIDLETGKTVANIPLDNRPYFIATGEDAVWVGGYDPKSRIVYRINPQTNQVVATIQLGPKGSIDNQGPIVTGEGAVWILHDKHSFLKGAQLLLSQVDPQANQVTATIPVDYRFAAWNAKIAVGSGSVWVAKYQKKIFRIDPQTSQVEDTFNESLDPRYWIINMAVTEDTLWILGFNSKDSILGLGEYDIEKNALRSITELGSSKFGKGSDELPVGESTIAAADDAVWACLPLGIYVIPKSTKTNEPGVP